MQLAAPAWLAKPAIGRFVRRVVFSLLAAWVHCAAFFFVAIVLFHGKGSDGANAPDTFRQSAQTIEISLQTTSEPAPSIPIPLPVPIPVQISTPATVAATTPPQGSAPAPEMQSPTAVAEKAPPAPIVPPKPQVEKLAQGGAAGSDGIAGCESLTKKPERIIFGDDYVQFDQDGIPPGQMTVREIINREGTVISVTVENSTMSKKMEDQVIAWAYRSFYHPGEIGGVAVDCEIKYVVAPTLNDH